MNKITVLKFGGTSVSRASENIIKVIEKESNENKNLIVVLSAFSGMTNILYKLIEEPKKLKENFNAYIKNYHDYYINENFTNQEIKNELLKVLVNVNKSFINSIDNLENKNLTEEQFLDTIVCYGERVSVQIYKYLLKQNGIDSYLYSSEMLITTNSNHQNAFPIMKLTQEKINKNLIPRMEKQKIILVTGFVAVDKDWKITTLGRSGSDFTATIIGSCINADKVIIYTDVNGILTSDPRKNIRAKTIDHLNYKQVSELAYFGAKVIHPKTLIPIIPKNIPVYVKNTFNLNQKGTIINNKKKDNRKIIDAITTISDFRLFTVHGLGMMGTIGISGKIFSILNEMGESTPFITQASSEQTICFAIKDKSCDKVRKKLVEVFNKEIEDRIIDKIEVSKDISIVTVVGENMINKCGVAGKIFTILGKHCINILAISQGTSELSISFVIDRNTEDIAIRVLHTLVE